MTLWTPASILNKTTLVNKLPKPIIKSLRGKKEIPTSMDNIRDTDFADRQ